MSNSKCFRCGSTVSYLKERGPHMGKYCKNCDRWIMWIKHKENNYTNINYVIKSGYHKGESIKQAVNNDPDWAMKIIKISENDFMKRNLEEAITTTIYKCK